MAIPIGTALLLGFIAGFSYFSRRFLGELYLERPIVLAPLAGLIMGDFQAGLVIGGTLELVFMGVTAIGGGVQPNMPLAAVLGTAFSVSAGLSVDEAVLLAVPASLLGSFFELLAKTVSTFFVNGAERFADQNNTAGVSLMVHLGNVAHFLAIGLPAFLALALGSELVQQFVDSIPPFINDGIGAAGAALPALGFALLLSTIASTEMLPYFFIGFLIAAYTEFGVLGVGVLGILVAAIYVIQQGGVTLLGEDDEDVAGVAGVAGVDDGGGVASVQMADDDVPATVPGEAPAGAALGTAPPGVTRASELITEGDRRTIFWRSFALQSAFSFDRMQSLGFTWALIPFLKKIYGDSAELGRALRRHMAFFNTHPWVPGPVLALVADLEAQRSLRGDEIEEQSIQGIKASLMGPLAGAADPLFHGTLRPLVGGIAASLALAGNGIAPLMFFVIMNVIHVAVRWWTTMESFRFGSTFFERLDAASLDRLMTGSAIAGLMATGGLVGTWLNITTPLTYTSAEGAVVTVQEMLDGIMPGLLPLTVTLLIYWAIRKGVSITVIMLVMVVVAIVLGGLGIIA
ncbi:MAG: PTS system mannose/fructose/sorbose family transporter subunit IID [Chloroflexota bacterium]